MSFPKKENKFPGTCGFERRYTDRPREDEAVDHSSTEKVRQEASSSVTDMSEVIETITINLITTRRITQNGISIRRSHQISTSRFIQPELIDWTNFFTYLQNELIQHAREQHNRSSEAEELD